MKQFNDENFLLQTATAQRLYMNMRHHSRLSTIIATSIRSMWPTTTYLKT